MTIVCNTLMARLLKQIAPVHYTIVQYMCIFCVTRCAGFTQSFGLGKPFDSSSDASTQVYENQLCIATCLVFFMTVSMPQ